MPKKIRLTIDGYLKKTYLGQEGEKDVTLQYSAAEALKIAQLELMGRDLRNHLPVLLRTTYEVSPENKKIIRYKGVTKEPKQRHYISRKSA